MFAKKTTLIPLLLKKRFVFLGLALLPQFASADDFCDGFELGFKRGYCYQQYACLEPLTPLCPLPKLGESGFEDGFKRGMLEGYLEKLKRGY
jgi:hypothetical protein